MEKPAHIDDMGRFFFVVLMITIILIFLFFPIYLETNAHYDMNRRKFAFVIYANKIIRLFGGYVATYSGGLALHTSKDKAILLPYSELNKERKRVSIIRTFRLKSLCITMETGAEYFMQIAVLQEIFQWVFLIMGGKREKLERNLWLTDGDVLRISVTFVIRLNLYMIVRNFIRFLKEKIKVLCQTKIKRLTI